MHIPYSRAPRVPGPALPRGEIVLEAPPALPETSGGAGQFLMLLPMLAGGGAMSLMFVGSGASPVGYLASGLYGVSTVGMFATSFGRTGGDRRRRIDGDRRDYLRYLAQTRRRVARAAAAQRDALRYANPDPATLWSVAASPRLWERRAADPDFAQARFAMGAHQLAIRLIPPETRPVEDLEPITAGALRRFLRAHATVADLPFALSLRGFARISLVGDDGRDTDRARDLVRAALAQLATFHAPDDLRIVVCAGEHRRGEWDWVKWLPHALHPERTDLAGPVRLVGEDLAELERLFHGDLEARSRWNAALAPLTDLPHLVVVLDEGARVAEAQLAQGGVHGVTVLDLAGVLDRTEDRTDASVLRLHVTGERLELLQKDATRPIGRPDRLARVPAEALARQLAPVRLVTGAEQAGPTDSVTLMSLLGIADPAGLDLATAWAPRAVRNQLRIPIGLSPAGTPVELDLKESALDGMGPHGMIIGATGSGKSELLRTLVLGLAVTHSSEALNLVLVDFKGGATFLGLEKLPHVSAVITNLADELPLVDRMFDAVHGELVRRQELLRRSGTFASLRDYEKARAAGAPLHPLPTLLVVVDEFSELLATKPEFAELFVMIGRLGRSLGVHLLLASQHLDEGRLRGLGTHLSYRIALRTFSAMESRTVIGVSDAYELPPSPGHGYLLFDNTTLVRFRAGYVSAPYRTGPPTPAASGPAPIRQVMWYSTRPAAAPVPAPATAPEVSTMEGPTLLDAVVERLHGQGPPAHQVWLPPLSAPPTLDELLGTAGPLSVPVGVVDRPFEQRRDPLWVELAGAAGHVAVVGGPRSGKSTAVCTLLGALAATHSPAEVQFYGIDLGGGALGTLAGLPHLGALARRRDAELVRRTIAELTGLLDKREKAFADAGITSVADYRRLRAESADNGLDDGQGDVFLVIDGWLTFLQEYEGLEPLVNRLAGRGLGYGIHLLLTANRWAEIRPALRELLTTRLELRLGEPFESEINRRAAANVPERSPGRGITKEGLHFLTALPRLDGRPSTEDLTAGLRDLTAQVAAGWTGIAPASPVRTLPRTLGVEQLPPATGAGLPIGLDENALAPVLLDFEADPHLTVYGDTESGKTNLLRLVARQLTERYAPEDARIMIVDYRRGLLDAVGTEHQIGYAPSTEALHPLVKDLVGALQVRLPGPSLTPEQLRTRSWWRGADLYLLVDDYDLVEGNDNPLAPLGGLLAHGRDIGLHLVVARAAGGASRASYEPVLRRIREMGCPGILLSGSPEEGPLIGKVRATPQPAGRGVLVSRRHGSRTIQTALLPAG